MRGVLLVGPMTYWMWHKSQVNPDVRQAATVTSAVTHHIGARVLFLFTPPTHTPAQDGHPWR
jgi:hypothetical protein